MALYNKNCLMHLRIGTQSIFDYILLATVIVACVIIAIRGSGRIRYNDVYHDKEQRKKND